MTPHGVVLSLRDLFPSSSPCFHTCLLSTSARAHLVSINYYCNQAYEYSCTRQWSRCSRQKPRFINASLLWNHCVQTLFPGLSPSHALELKNTYQRLTTRLLNIRFLSSISSPSKVICMRTASLGFPSAPYFAPVVNISLFHNI